MKNGDLHKHNTTCIRITVVVCRPHRFRDVRFWLQYSPVLSPLFSYIENGDTQHSEGEQPKNDKYTNVRLSIYEHFYVLV